MRTAYANCLSELLIRTAYANCLCELLIRTAYATCLCELLVRTACANCLCELLVRTACANCLCELLVRTACANCLCELLMRGVESGGYGHPPALWPNGLPNACDAPCNRVNISVGKDPAHHVWNSSERSKQQVSSYFGGYWYSTTKAGQCAEGHAPGDGSGCTWRITGPSKYVNASCVADQLFGVLKEANPSCFAACGPGAGRGNPCFAKCVTETVL